MLTIYSVEELLGFSPKLDYLTLYPRLWKWDTRLELAGIDSSRVDPAWPQDAKVNYKDMAGWIYDEQSFMFGRALTWTEVNSRLVERYNSLRRS